MPPIPLDIGSRSLLFFFDESGDPKFRDPQHPLFAWAGCAMRGDTYWNVVRPAWLDVRNRFWPGRVKPLHANKLRKLDRLAPFFAAQTFARIAVVGTVESEFHHGLDPLTCLGIVLRGHVIEIAEREPLSHVALLFESSAHHEATVHRHLGPAVDDLRARGVRVDFGFMQKSACEPGMEIADIIAHTAGRHARREPVVEIALDGGMSRIVAVPVSAFDIERELDEDVPVQEPEPLIDAVLPRRSPKKAVCVDVRTAGRSADGERILVRSVGR